MATKKKSSPAAASRAGQSQSEQTADSEAFEQAIVRFGEAIQLMHDGQHESAKGVFDELESSNPDEPVLAERARSYSMICAAKLASPPAPPANSEEYYLRGVVQSNNGEFDEALRLLDQAVGEHPTSAKYLYARAATFALKGNVDSAIDNLRQAITAEPTTRFQAVNDPDFEQIREEPAFIDIIEPTPSGA